MYIFKSRHNISVYFNEFRVYFSLVSGDAEHVCTRVYVHVFRTVSSGTEAATLPLVEEISDHHATGEDTIVKEKCFLE